MAKHKLRMAKASKEDIKSTMNFLHAMQQVSSLDFDIKEWEEDEELLPIFKRICSGGSEPTIDGLLWAYKTIDSRWMRVIMAAEVLVENVCDPELSYLEYKPELKDSLPRDRAKNLVSWALKRSQCVQSNKPDRLKSTLVSRSKTIENREGYLNRHLVPLPTKVCTIKIIVKDYSGEHATLCEWKPFEAQIYNGSEFPADGYLGTAKELQGVFSGIGHHAWEQNDSEFIYYKIVK